MNLPKTLTIIILLGIFIPMIIDIGKSQPAYIWSWEEIITGLFYGATFWILGYWSANKDMDSKWEQD